ncbi:MAG TPA: hypothetical protein VIE65_04555, partial [Methylobacter sp.]
MMVDAIDVNGKETSAVDNCAGNLIPYPAAKGCFTSHQNTNRRSVLNAVTNKIFDRVITSGLNLTVESLLGFPFFAERANLHD